MEPKTNLLLKSTFNYGLYLGIVLIIYTLLLFILGVMPVGFLKPILLGLTSIAIYVIGIVILTKKVRAELYNGEVTYGQAFLIGLLIALFATIISSVYSYIQNTLIDSDYFVRIMNAQKDWMFNFMSSKGVSEEQIEKAITKIDEQIKNYSPLKSVFTGFLGSAVFGAIISLITSAFLKKKTNPFENPNV
ncbi:MAG: DUF4199 domain-containing protein [Bacteroidales bacterium]|nr:MAG: DUF4199 domain-containing protein [Bacteroidales bacterium]